MKKFVTVVMAAAFAAASFVAPVQAADKKPSAEECKKNPKMKGCEAKK